MMENISIETSQNIDIEQPIASVGERIAATALDMLFLLSYASVVVIVGGAVKAPVAMLLFILPVFLYHLICEILMNGQSLGKKILKIKVVKIDGTQATFITYFIRWIFRLVDVMFLFGGISTLVIILNGKGQRLGDIAANSTVIRLKNNLKETGIFVTLPENYTLVFATVNRLNDSDIATVREILNFLKESHHSVNSLRMAEQARSALEAKMGVRSELETEKFLISVIYDYNYIHTR